MENMYNHHSSSRVRSVNTSNIRFSMSENIPNTIRSPSNVSFGSNAQIPSSDFSHHQNIRHQRPSYVNSQPAPPQPNYAPNFQPNTMFSNPNFQRPPGKMNPNSAQTRINLPPNTLASNMNRLPIVPNDPYQVQSQYHRRNNNDNMQFESTNDRESLSIQSPRPFVNNRQLESSNAHLTYNVQPPLSRPITSNMNLQFKRGPYNAQSQFPRPSTNNNMLSESINNSGYFVTRPQSQRMNTKDNIQFGSTSAPMSINVDLQPQIPNNINNIQFETISACGPYNIQSHKQIPTTNDNSQVKSNSSHWSSNTELRPSLPTTSNNMQFNSVSAHDHYDLQSTRPNLNNMQSESMNAQKPNASSHSNITPLAPPPNVGPNSNITPLAPPPNFGPNSNITPLAPTPNIGPNLCNTECSRPQPPNMLPMYYGSFIQPPPFMNFTQANPPNFHVPVSQPISVEVSVPKKPGWEKEEKLDKFLEKLSKKTKQQIHNDITVKQFRNILKVALNIRKELTICKEKLCEVLDSDVNTWNLHFQKALQLQDQLIQVSDLLSSINLKTIKKKFDIIKKKRAVKKKLKKKALIRKAEKLKEREEINHKIDKWLDSVKEKNLKLKREVEMKKEADCILSEVRRKIHEAKRTIEKIKVFEKLRNARQENAEKRGLFLPKHYERFQEKISHLKETMQRQLSHYESEEKALKVMLEAEQEGQLEEEVKWKTKKLRTLQERRQKNIMESLFGDSEEPEKDDPIFLFYRYHNSGNESIESLVQIRHQWDKHISEDGEAIPQQWVVPAIPSSASWKEKCS